MTSSPVRQPVATMTSPPVNTIFIIGPTGIGKTKLSITVALALNGEVISVDSLQCYRDGPIMTARVTQEEMKGVPHHMIDYLDCDEEPSTFLDDSLQAMADIHARGKVAVFCGGSTSLTAPLLFHPNVVACRPHIIALFADESFLNPRTDDRIDQMVEQGLLDEIRELRKARNRCQLGDDPLCGVFKSIGYPELADRVRAYSPSSFQSCLGRLKSRRDRLSLDRGLARMKLHTREYSRMQQRWIWDTIVPQSYKTGLRLYPFRVDSVKHFAERVEQRVVDLFSQ